MLRRICYLLPASQTVNDCKQYTIIESGAMYVVHRPWIQILMWIGIRSKGAGPALFAADRAMWAVRLCLSLETMKQLDELLPGPVVPYRKSMPGRHAAGCYRLYESGPFLTIRVPRDLFPAKLCLDEVGHSRTGQSAPLFSL